MLQTISILATFVLTAGAVLSHFQEKHRLNGISSQNFYRGNARAYIHQAVLNTRTGFLSEPFKITNPKDKLGFEKLVKDFDPDISPSADEKQLDLCLGNGKCERQWYSELAIQNSVLKHIRNYTRRHVLSVRLEKYLPGSWIKKNQTLHPFVETIMLPIEIENTDEIKCTVCTKGERAALSQWQALRFDPTYPHWINLSKTTKDSYFLVIDIEKQSKHRLSLWKRLFWGLFVTENQIEKSYFCRAMVS
jgi:hypothetical protein